MGRYFQTADYKPTIDFLYEPDWALTERVLKTEQDSLDAQREQIEAWKNLQIEHLGGAADAENSKRILDYIRNVADEYSNAIESDKLDARAYTPNLKNFQNELLKNYREGDIARIQSSPAALRAWEKEHEKFKESHPEYYAHARQKFLNDYHSSGGNSLVRGWQGQALARPIDVEKVTQHAYKLMAEKTGWTRDTTDGTWINSNGQKVEKLEANRIFQNIMGTILADPANQAFMRQSTELGYMRYLDDKGNVDYNSPGLNPYNSIAQSISYENRQTDHSMRADDYGKMAKQHQYDVAMENLRHKNAKALKKYEKELEEPPATVGLFDMKETTYATSEQVQEDLKSNDPVKKAAAQRHIAGVIADALGGKYDINGADKKFYDALVEHATKNGFVNGNLGDTMEHVANKSFGGNYYTSQEKIALAHAATTEKVQLQAKINENRKRLKENPKDTQAIANINEYNARIKNIDDVLSGKRKNDVLQHDKSFIRKAAEVLIPGFGGLSMLYGKENVKIGVKNGDYKNIGYNTVVEKTKDMNHQFVSLPVNKATGQQLAHMARSNSDGIAVYDPQTGQYTSADPNFMSGKTVKDVQRGGVGGELVANVVDEKGNTTRVKINSNNEAFNNAFTNLALNGTPSNLEAKYKVTLTPQYNRASQHFNTTAINDGNIGYVGHPIVGSDGKPYVIVKNENDEFRVAPVPSNGNFNMNDTQKLRTTFENGSKVGRGSLEETVAAVLNIR